MNEHACSGAPRVPKTSHLRGDAARQFPSLWAHWIRSSLQLLSQQPSRAQGITHVSEPANSTATLASTVGRALSPCPLPNGTTLSQKVLTKCLVWVLQPCPGWGQGEDASRGLAATGRPWEASRRGTLCSVQGHGPVTALPGSQDTENPNSCSLKECLPLYQVPKAGTPQRGRRMGRGQGTRSGHGDS